MATDPQIPVTKLDPTLNPVKGEEDTAKPLTDVLKGVPFRGGVFTDRDVNLVPTGGYSWIQNMRDTHPGFEKRKGCRKHHSTADGSNEVVSLFQFSKGKVTERHLYAQMSDGDVLDATDQPPTVTTGAFGSEVFSGDSTLQVPASWGVVDDTLVYSDGSAMHQIYPGSDSSVKRVIVYVGSKAPAIIPDQGKDFTDQATDGLSTTYVDLSSLGDLAVDYDCIFVMTTIPATSIKWTMSSINTTTAVAAGKYYNGAWTAMTGFTDGTIDGGCAFGKTGSMSWTAPTDEIPHYMYNQCGFWYQIYLSSGDLDSNTKSSAVEYNTTWQPLVNVWDSALNSAVETQFYDASADTYTTFGNVNIDISDGTSSDILYVGSLDRLIGIYVDVQMSPNETASTTIPYVYYWKDGNAWAAVSNLNDGTAGFSQSGFITFSRQTDVYKQQFGGLNYDMYWYKIVWDKTLSIDVNLTIETMPYYDITEYGQKGIVSSPWRSRMVYCFDRWPVDLFVSALYRPMVLDGEDAAVLERPGDGRMNKVVCIKPFFNNILVFQEERGTDGGCITMYQGYNPSTFGKLLISTNYGTFSQKSAVVVDGVSLGWNKIQDSPVTVCYFLSRSGVFVTNGTTVKMISRAPESSIQNYFDPKEPECIRRGYENKMWMMYDSTYQCLRIGLVSGSSATTPNVFLVYDIEDKTWKFDSLAQEFSCCVEVEAASGDTVVLQAAGGTDDGTVYQTNYGDSDVSTAIDAYATMEIDGDGAEIIMREFIIRNSGECTLTPYVEGVAQTAITVA